MTVETHEALITLFDGNEVISEEERTAYDGPPDWKWRPLDPARRAEWEAATADPARLDRERNLQTRSLRGPLAKGS